MAGTEGARFTRGGGGSWWPSALALTPKLTVIGTSLPYPSKSGRNDLDFTFNGVGVSLPLPAP